MHPYNQRFQTSYSNTYSKRMKKQKKHFTLQSSFKSNSVEWGQCVTKKCKRVRRQEFEERIILGGYHGLFD